MKPVVVAYEGHQNECGMICGMSYWMFGILLTTVCIVCLFVSPSITGCEYIARSFCDIIAAGKNAN